MAKAEIVVMIAMSSEEATCLIDILRCVGGDPKLTRRCHADSIYDALNAQGISGTKNKDIASNSHVIFTNG